MTKWLWFHGAAFRLGSALSEPELASPGRRATRPAPRRFYQDPEPDLLGASPCFEEVQPSKSKHLTRLKGTYQTLLEELTVCRSLEWRVKLSVENCVADCSRSLRLFCPHLEPRYHDAVRFYARRIGCGRLNLLPFFLARGGCNRQRTLRGGFKPIKPSLHEVDASQLNLMRKAFKCKTSMGGAACVRWSIGLPAGLLGQTQRDL